MMDLQNFQRYAATFGGDLSRWPRELLPAATARLKADPMAQEFLDEAVFLDGLIADYLQQDEQITPSADLRTRLLALPEQYPTTFMASSQWMAHSRPVALGLALCLLLGLFAGMTTTLLPSANTQANSTAWILAPDLAED